MPKALFQSDIKTNSKAEYVDLGASGAREARGVGSLKGNGVMWRRVCYKVASRRKRRGVKMCNV